MVHEAIRAAWEYVRMVVAYGSARDRAPQAGRGRRAIPRRGDHADPTDQPSYVPKRAIAAHRSPNTLKDNMITKTAYFFMDNSGYPCSPVPVECSESLKRGCSWLVTRSTRSVETVPNSGWRHTIRRTSMVGQAAREIADVYGSTCLAAGCGSVVMLGRGTG